MTQYELSTDPARLPLDIIYSAVSRLLQCAAPPHVAFPRAVANSLNFAVYSPSGDLAAYARVISDKATFARITDAFVLETHRGQGLAKLIIDAISTHPDLAGLPLFTMEGEHGGFYAHCGRPLHPPAHGLLELGPASV